MATITVILATVFLCFVISYGNPCYEGWIVNGDSCYGFASTPLSFIESASVCSLFGSGLIEVNSQEENDFVAAQLRLHRISKAWIGATDMFNDSNFQYVGKKDNLTFTDWYAGDNDWDEEDNCVIVQQSRNFQWLRDRCNHANNFICETTAEETVVG